MAVLSRAHHFLQPAHAVFGDEARKIPLRRLLRAVVERLGIDGGVEPIVVRARHVILGMAEEIPVQIDVALVDTPNPGEAVRIERM